MKIEKFLAWWRLNECVKLYFSQGIRTLRDFIEFLAAIETQQSHKPTEIIAYAIKDIGRLSHKEKPLISSNNNYFSTILNTWKEKAVDRKLYKGGCYYSRPSYLKWLCNITFIAPHDGFVVLLKFCWHYYWCWVKLMRFFPLMYVVEIFCAYVMCHKLTTTTKPHESFNGNWNNL